MGKDGSAQTSSHLPNETTSSRSLPCNRCINRLCPPRPSSQLGRKLRRRQLLDRRETEFGSVLWFRVRLSSSDRTHAGWRVRGGGPDRLSVSHFTLKLRPGLGRRPGPFRYRRDDSLAERTAANKRSDHQWHLYTCPKLHRPNPLGRAGQCFCRRWKRKSHQQWAGFVRRQVSSRRPVDLGEWHSTGRRNSAGNAPATL